MIAHLYSGCAAALAELCRAAPGLETGGILLSVQDPRNLAIMWAEGPGPGAALAPQRMVWDASYLAGLLAGLQYSDVRPIGRWHKHCAPDLRASEEDRRGAEAFRRALGAEAIVDLIVATDQDEPIGWAAYLCSEGGYERIRLDLPQGAGT